MKGYIACYDRIYCYGCELAMDVTDRAMYFTDRAMCYRMNERLIQYPSLSTKKIPTHGFFLWMFHLLDHLKEGNAQ